MKTSEDCLRHAKELEEFALQHPEASEERETALSMADRWREIAARRRVEEAD